MRNLWHIMKTFNVLPTNEDFRALTDDQLEIMIFSMEADHKAQELAQKGLSADDEQFDTSFEDEVWSKDVGDWEVLKEGHDPDDIAKQIEEATAEEDRKNLYAKFDTLEEYNDFLAEGGTTAKENEVEEYIDKQIRVAQDKAKMMEASKGKGKGGKKFVSDSDLPEVMDDTDTGAELDLEKMQGAIDLFNEKNDEDEDDDEFIKL